MFIKSNSLAQVPTKDFIVKIELQRSEVIQGEPLILRYAIKNISGIPVDWNMEHDPRDYLKVKVKTKSGRNVNLTWDFRSIPSQRTHTGMSSDPRLDSGVNRQGKIVLGQWVQFNRPGTYEVEIELTPPIRSSYYDGKERFTKAFEVVVKPFSSVKLRKLGEEYLKQSFSTKEEDRMIALQSLFSLPESSASELWRTLLQKPLGVNEHNEVREQLERIGSSLTRGLFDVLAEKSYNERPNYVDFKPSTPPSDK